MAAKIPAATDMESSDGAGTRDDEFEEIQMALEGLSKDLGDKIDSSTTGKVEEKRQKVASLNLESLVTYSDDQFQSKIKTMQKTDLDLALMFFEEHIKAHTSTPGAGQNVVENQRSKEDFKKLQMYRDRLNMCFLEKVKRSRVSDQEKSHSLKIPNDEEAPELPSKPRRFLVRASASPEEFDSMTKTQLRALLRHHSIDHTEEAEKEALMELVIDKVLQGERGDWEPPPESEMQWVSHGNSSKGTTTHHEQNADVGLDETDWKMSVSITDQKSMVDWDPVPLVKELFKTITGKQMETDKGCQDESPIMSGYLEKLPVNQTKAKAFKGWKRRFFKIEKGKLFYFEDHKSDSSLGFVNLRGSKVTVPGEKMLQVTSELNGDTVVLRCSSTHESKDWYRVLHEEAIASLKRKGMTNSTSGGPVVVIDLGATAVRGGFAADGLPTVAFPSVYAVKNDRGSFRKFADSGVPDPHLCTCGFDALRPQNRKVSKIIYPMRPSLKIDKYAVKVRYLPGFIEKVFQSLYTSPTDAVVIISCPQYVGDKDKEYLLDYLFGQLNVKAVYIQQQAVLSLYSYSDTSGILVDIGDHIDVIPMVEGNIVNQGRTSLPYGGQQITENLSKLLTQTGHRFFSDIESYVVRYVKEKCAFVSDEALTDKPINIPRAGVDVKAFALPNHEKVIDVDSAQVKCTEGLFDPQKWGKDEKGIHVAVANAIKACGIDERKEMCRKIYLSGGTTLLRGFPERLQKELKKILPDGLTIQVQAGESRLNAAFKGACLLSELPTFPSVLVSKEEWQSQGIEVLSRWHQK